MASPLSVLPTRTLLTGSALNATVDDHQSNVNLKPFGMCRSPSNPQVAAATAAASGVLTPQPCVPVTPAPWSPGSTITTFDDVAALLDVSTCDCQWVGVIEVEDPAPGMLAVTEDE